MRGLLDRPLTIMELMKSIILIIKNNIVSLLIIAIIFSIPIILVGSFKYKTLIEYLFTIISCLITMNLLGDEYYNKKTNVLLAINKSFTDKTSILVIIVCGIQIVAVYLGTMAFIIPGIIIMIYSLVAPQIALFEKKGIIESFKGSFYSIKGSGVYIFIITIILALVLSGFNSIFLTAISNTPQFSWLFTMGISLVNVMQGVAITCVYFHLNFINKNILN